MTNSGSNETNTGTPAQPADSGGGPDLDSPERWRFGLIAVLAGLVALLVAFALVVLMWDNDKGIAALGVITSPIVAVVSAYFGIQATQQASAQVAVAHEHLGEARVETSHAVADSAASEEKARQALEKGRLLAKHVAREDAGRRSVGQAEMFDEAQAEGGDHPQSLEPDSPTTTSAADLARDLFPEVFDDRP